MNSPLVCFHGMGGHPADFDGMLGLLEQKGTVWRPFLPGHGNEGAAILKRNDSYRNIVQKWLDQNQKELNAKEKPTLLGYSFGARFALQLALLDPDRWKQLILIGLNPGLCSLEEKIDRKRNDQSWADLIRKEGLASFWKKWQEQPVLGSLYASFSDHEKQIYFERRSIHQAEGLARAFELLGTGCMEDLWSESSKLEQSILLIDGEKDKKFSKIHSEFLGFLQNGQQLTIENAGHAPHLENPSGLIARLQELL